MTRPTRDRWNPVESQTTAPEREKDLYHGISYHASVTSNAHADDETDRASVQSEPMDVEMYEDDGSVVLFDAGNPLAWVEAATTVTLHDAA